MYNTCSLCRLARYDVVVTSYNIVNVECASCLKEEEREKEKEEEEKEEGVSVGGQSLWQHSRVKGE